MGLLKTIVGPAIVGLAVSAAPAAGQDAALQNLNGPRGTRWGDSVDKVAKTEGRDPAGSMEGCLTFREVDIDGRKYEISYQCLEKGGRFGSINGWRPTGKGITTAALHLQPFGPPRDAEVEIAWWEKELTSKYGAPDVRVDAAVTTEVFATWPNACPPFRTSPSTWNSAECPIQMRFTKYRRWTGKRTVIELYDQGGHGLTSAASHFVEVLFSDRAFFDAAEAVRQRAISAATKKQGEQNARRKRAPAF